MSPLDPDVEGRVVRAVGSIGLATLLSRVLGYARDMALAAVFGAGPVTDAFLVAFRIPNLLRRLLAEGALATAVIPVLGESLARDSREAFHRLTRAVAALYTVGWVRDHPDEARVLLLHRREELVSGPWPAHLKDDAASLTQEMNAGISRFAEKYFGGLSSEALRRAAFAPTDVPLAALRPHVERGEQPPGFVDQLVRETYLDVMRIQR